MTPSTRDADSIRLRYGQREVAARRGQRLLDVLMAAGIDHRHVCGGLGFCTSCRVEVVQGERNLSPVSRLERERLGRDAGCLRLACQATIAGPVAVRVPPPPPARFAPDDE